MGSAGDLRAALAAAPDVRAASRALADHLAAAGLLPSVYLERGGRLRCQAIEGSWQIRDGLAAGHGVIGRVLRTGEPAIVPDVRACDDYVEVLPGVVAEACVSIHQGDRLVGVLNVEADRPLDPELPAELAACAERLGELGGPPPASPAKRLVAHATRLSGLTDAREIDRLVVDAARDVSGMDSAALLGRDAAGRLVAQRAAGPLADALSGAREETIAIIDSFVAAGSSCSTDHVRAGDAPPGIQALRDSGAQTVIALRVLAGPALRGVLVLADSGSAASSTEAVELLELLELLVAQAGSCLRTAAAVEELRQRAARDPLTGLGHHATFHEPLARWRADRATMAVAIADVDGWEAINDGRGHQAGDRVLREVSSALSSALRRGDELFRIGGDPAFGGAGEFAALIAVADRGRGVDPYPPTPAAARRRGGHRARHRVGRDRRPARGGERRVRDRPRRPRPVRGEGRGARRRADRPLRRGNTLEGRPWPTSAASATSRSSPTSTTASRRWPTASSS